MTDPARRDPGAPPGARSGALDDEQIQEIYAAAAARDLDPEVVARLRELACAPDDAEEPRSDVPGSAAGDLGGARG